MGNWLKLIFFQSYFLIPNNFLIIFIWQCFDKFYNELEFIVEFTNQLPKRNYEIANYNSWDYTWSLKDKLKCSCVVYYLKQLSIKKYGNITIKFEEY